MTVRMLEIVLLCTASVGWALSAWLVLQCWRDRREIVENHTGDRLSWHTVRAMFVPHVTGYRELITFERLVTISCVHFVQAVLLLHGLLVLAYHPPVSTRPRVFIVVSSMAMSLVLMIGMAVRKYVRAELYRQELSNGQ